MNTWKKWRFCIALGMILGLGSATLMAGEEDAPTKRLQALLEAGRFQDAVATGQSALADADPTDKVDLLLGLAEAHRILGYQNEAEEELQQAATLSGTLSLEEKVQVLAAQGDSALALNRPDEAKKLLKQGLELARSIDGGVSVARLLNNMGTVYIALGDVDQATAQYDKALEQTGVSEDVDLMVAIKINRARTVGKIGSKDSGKLIREALARLISLPASHGRAMKLVAVGQILFQQYLRTGGPPQESLLPGLDAAQAAEKEGRKLDDGRVLSEALGLQGEMYEYERRYVEARQLTQQALFHAEANNAPESVYAWQWQLARLAQAEGRTDEAIVGYRAALVTLNGLRRELIYGQRHGPEFFRERVAPVYYQLADILLSQASVAKEDKIRQGDLHDARNIIEQLKTSEIQNLFQDECLAAQRGRSADVEQVQAGSAVLYPILLKNRLELLISQGDRIRQFTVPVTAAAVGEESRLLRLQLETAKGNGYLSHAQQLYRWLIEPEMAWLRQEGVKILVVVPDGQLRTVPFAAFHDGNHFLAEEMAVAVTPSLKLTDPRQMARQQIRMLVDALSEGKQGFPPLLNVPHEVETIRTFFPGQILMDQDYTVANSLKSVEEQPYSIVHIASHGQFDRDPKKTFLLAYDGRLTMNGLEEMVGVGHLRDEPIELLTMSACQTAVGDDRAALGLAGVAIKAGARSALASLWFIDDAATSVLMGEFYSKLQDSTITKAEALRQAQMKLITDPRMNHPGYWAAFILIGNWL